MEKGIDKAAERAIEKYPIEMYEEVGWRCVDKNSDKRKYFIEGYHQAEKDLELTWEDMREIYYITLNLKEHLGASVFGEPLYQEVLKRFKARKEL